MGAAGRGRAAAGERRVGPCRHEGRGAALRAAGVTVTLAPVGDVPTVTGAALAGRAFSQDP